MAILDWLHYILSFWVIVLRHTDVYSTFRQLTLVAAAENMKWRHGIPQVDATGELLGFEG